MTLKKDTTERPLETLGCKNATGSDIPAKRFVTGTEDSITLTAADTDPILGVTRSVIKAGQYGPVMLRGKAVVTAGVGGTTAAVRVKPEAATGKAIIWGTGKSEGGIARDTVSADVDVEVELSGPGITAQ